MPGEKVGIGRGACDQSGLTKPSAGINDIRESDGFGGWRGGRKGEAPEVGLVGVVGQCCCQ